MPMGTPRVSLGDILDPPDRVMDARAEPDDISTEAVILSVPSIDRRTHIQCHSLAVWGDRL